MRLHSTRSPPQRLESLPTSTTDRSPSLRGSKHDRVPHIPNHPLNTALPVTKDGVPHPQPFYVTQVVVLRFGDGRPPWKEVNKQSERRLLDLWDSNQGFRDKYLQELLKDCLYEQINTICSGYLVGANSRLKKDRKLLMWLHEQVIEPTVYDECERAVYEDLWDSARMLTESEAKPYARMYGEKAVDPTFLTFLKDHHRNPLSPDEGKSIYGHRWGEVVYHLNKIISRASLVENYGIRKLQEQFITQIAAQVLFEEGIKYMEEEMKQMDEADRVDKPPRSA